MGIVLAVLMFSLIVLIHEFGHFIFAKMHGITVNEFALGMGPKIVGVKKGETEYVWRALPFGGACVMLGEDGDAGDETQGSFTSKSVWARMSVILAGPLFNFILAFVFAMFILGNIGFSTGKISSVEEGSPAAEAGLAADDVIVRIDNTNIHMFKELSMYMYLNPGQEYEVTYERDGQKNTVKIMPFYDEELGTYRIGIGSSPYQKASVTDMFKYAFYEVKYNINVVIKSLGMLFSGRVSKDDVAGPVGMVSMIGENYNEAKNYGVMSVLLTMAQLIVILSANLGVMNLLPIPALDGGRLLFLIIEAVRRKPLDRNKEGFVNFIGFALLMIIMVLVLFNDISKLFR